MNSIKKIEKRGDFSGLIYEVDHLATFTVGTKQGLLRAEDGMRKLRIMEKSQGIWTMQCQLMIDRNFLIIFDRKDGRQVEMFPLSLIYDPTSVVSSDASDVYNNIILFTVLQDSKSSAASSSNNTEMHIFQCLSNHSAEVVDELFQAKEGIEPAPVSLPHPPVISAPVLVNNNRPPANTNINMNPPNQQYRKNGNFSTILEMTSNSISSVNLPPAVETISKETEIQVLNHCFDDIEDFVSLLQNSSEHTKELEKRRHKQQKSNKKSSSSGDGLLSMRAQMPAPDEFVAVFQKFKLSFNILAKLKAHIRDPNAPELVHFLFAPLALVANTAKTLTVHQTTDDEISSEPICTTVWQPLLSKDARELLLNCLTSKEQTFWQSLGEAWTLTRDDVRQQSHIYGRLVAQSKFTLTFNDGWQPIGGLGVYHVDSVQQTTATIAPPRQALSHHHHASQNSRYPFMQQQRQGEFNNQTLDNSNSSQGGFRFAKNSINADDGQRSAPPFNTNSKPAPLVVGQVNENSRTLQSARPALTNTTTNSIAARRALTKGGNQNKIANYNEMVKWAHDLAFQQGIKVCESVHTRMANNAKELTVKNGELFQVLDDKKNWWRLRNMFGQEGHAPVTILRDFDFNSIENKLQ